MKILAISGSLRKGSFNTRLLKAAGEFIGPDASIELFDLADIPLYNGDLDGEVKPAPVKALLDAIAAADALLISTPEYNYSVSGVLKNAIDWASRPAFDSVLLGKPTGVISSSMSTLGGARAQVHLRDIFAGTLTPVFLTPDFALATAHKAFDEDGALVNEGTREFLQKYMQGYTQWVAGQLG
ncbi:NADPH-dependent FMN reductase [Marinobacter sp. X15-166B]|uniref:NADPH-dependent FMN reductase n=1 Tax=Marinobacter sp. X15-166B TaxID=1897620 RepID=UPI00085CC982|nr:NADPH-dependent FMN reductase [Marinobacter sp. X15-166B]OEY65102.1 chromate reductase [Marinobacter sp. X15-166B]